MQVDLGGQVALVRGAAGPWGAAIVERLLANGADVFSTGSPQDARREAGRLDMLVNADPLVLEDPVGAADAVRDAMTCCEAAAAAMTEGRIVNIGAISGVVPSAATRHLAAASASLFVQTRALAVELAPRGIRVNAIAAMIESSGHTPLGRGAEPADLVAAVLFLLAAASSYVVGEVIRVDGGWSSGYARAF